MSPSYGSDGFRYLRDRALGRIGAAGVDEGGALPTQVVPYQTFYTKGNYSVFAFNFALAGTPPGATHDAYWTITPSIFPNQSVLDWKVPQGTIPNSLGVWGYHHIDYLNYDSSVQQTQLPGLMLAAITKYDQLFNWSYSGSPDFGLLAEEWLTWRMSTTKGNSAAFFTGNTTATNPTITNLPGTAASLGIEPGHIMSGSGIPAGARVLSVSGTTLTMSANASLTASGVSLTAARNLAETGALLHANDRTFHDTDGVLIGTSFTSKGIVYTVKRHGAFPYYYTTMPVTPQDVLTQGFDRKAFWDFMTYWGELTGSEWVNGTAFGVEPNFQAGSGTQSGKLTVSNYAIDATATAGVPTLAYLGVDQIAGQTFNDTAMTRTAGQPDIYGGNTAIRLLETTANSPHDHFLPEAASIFPTRECDVRIAFDVQGVSRTDFRVFIAGTSFANQLQSDFNTVSLAHSQASVSGTGLTTIKRDIIDLGSGVFRLVVQFKKSAGVTSLFADLQVGDGSGFSYVGDITKGVIVHSKRVSVLKPITITGSPGAATTNSPYSYTPTLAKGGQDPIVYSTSGTALPTGLSINSSTGEISGTPTVQGNVSGIIINADGANGSFGSQTVSINVTTAVAPTNTVAPVITNPSVQQGFVVQGQTLSTSNGTWSGTSPTYSYQWKRGGTNIGGATASTYIVQAADDAAAITCDVTATNLAGNATATATGNPTAIAGTLRLNENFAGGQGSWSSSGGVTYTSQILSWSTTAFNGVTVPATGTNGKQFRTIADYVAGANPGVRFGMGTGGAATPFGAIVTTSQKIDQTVSESGAITQFAVQFTGSTTTVGSLDNILVVERP